MGDWIATLIAMTASALEIAGISVISLGALFSTVRGIRGYLGRDPGGGGYVAYRRELSRAILLGLEFLVAADIIRTVAIEPSFTSVGILGAIVLIRTFLSFTLEVEVTGRWPWSHPTATDDRERAAEGSLK